MGWWQQVQDIYGKYGIQGVEQLVNSGALNNDPGFSDADRQNLGSWIASKQAEASDKSGGGFAGAIGNALGLNKVINDIPALTPAQIGFQQAGLNNSDLLTLAATAGAAAPAGAPSAAGGSSLYDYPTLADSGQIMTDVGPGVGSDPFAGLTGVDLGTDVPYFSTNPSLADLGGDISATSGTGPSGIWDTLNGYANSVNNVVNSPAGKLLGRVAPSLLGYLGSKKQTQQLQQQATDYSAMGAPYRQMLSDLYSNPSSFLSSPEVQVPVQQATNIMARSLSQNGNPAGSGNALQQLQSYSADQLFSRLGQEKDRLGGFGGLTYYNQAAPQAQTNAIASQGNQYNALGAGAANIFNPPQTLAQQLADFKRLAGSY